MNRRPKSTVPDHRASSIAAHPLCFLKLNALDEYWSAVPRSDGARLIIPQKKTHHTPFFHLWTQPATTPLPQRSRARRCCPRQRKSIRWPPHSSRGHRWVQSSGLTSALPTGLVSSLVRMTPTTGIACQVGIGTSASSCRRHFRTEATLSPSEVKPSGPKGHAPSQDAAQRRYRNPMGSPASASVVVQTQGMLGALDAIDRALAGVNADLCWELILR